MKVYKFTFDGIQHSPLFSDIDECRRFAAKWLFNNYKYKSEANAWTFDIVTGRFSNFNLASGGHFRIETLVVE